MKTAANASPNPVYGTTTSLTFAAYDGFGQTNDLFYEWSVIAQPAGVPAPTFSVNDSASANDTTATFNAAGSYIFEVTAANPSGQVVAETVPVTVSQTATSISVTAPTLSLYENGAEQFAATELDQFGNPMSPQPASFTWSANNGTINSAGPATGGVRRA